MFWRTIMLMAPDNDGKGSGGASGGEGGSGGNNDSAAGQGGQSGAGDGKKPAGDGKKPAGEDKKPGQGDQSAKGGRDEGASGKARERIREDDDDDDEPETENGMVKAMPLKAFLRRVTRMTNKELKRIFGHSDVEKIIAERKELEDLRQYKTTAEKEKLTEKQRLEKEREEAREEAKKEREAREQAEARAVYKETNSDLRDVALRYVDRGDVNDMLDKLAREIIKHPSEFKNKKDVRGWFKEYITKHPKWAKSGDDKNTAAKKAEEKPAKKVKIDNGPKGGKRADSVNGAGGENEKDIMTMSKAEIKERFGIDY